MANPGQSRTFRVVLWIVGLLLIVFGFFFLRWLTRETVEVRVARASYETLSSTVSTNGKVEPVNEYPANAPFSGVLQKIYVHVGDPVQPGTLLVQMSDADAKARIATAEASVSGSQLALRDIQQGGSFDERDRYKNDLAGARADASRAKSTLETDQELFAKGAVSAGEVTAAQQNLATTQRVLASAESRASERFTDADRGNAKAHVADAQAVGQKRRPRCGRRFTYFSHLSRMA